jgi:aminoglycoside phosphotransferase (APT) family kinase protein
LRLEPYYAFAATQVPAAAPFLHGLIEATRAHRLTLVHGDYSPKNILVHGGKLVLLDHEVIHFGDPSFDLGFSLTHLLSKAHHLAGKREAFAAAANVYWQAYLEALGRVAWLEGFEARVVRQTLACLLARVAGRSQFEYLSADERQRQREAAVSLMAQPPKAVPDLVGAFLERL